MEAIPERYRLEFWQEIMFVNIRRIRALLLFAVGGFVGLIYAVDIVNVLLLSESERRVVLGMHVFLLLESFVVLALVFVRPLRLPEDVTPYHTIVMTIATVAMIVGAEALMYAITITKGHPVFFFIAVAIWYSALLIPPRVTACVLVVMLSGFWVVQIFFSPPTADTQLAPETYLASVGLTIALILTEAFLFRSTVEAFRQRKAVEEERNRVRELNTELRAAYLEEENLNQELQHRHEVLEEQAIEIEIINTKLQEQNEQLLQLDTEKGELLGIVSHDLKNPISAVLGLAEMLQSLQNEGVAGENEHSTAITGQIILTAHQMLELVKNLLDLNRLESGAMALQMTEVDVAPLAESLCAQYQQRAASKNITIRYICSGEPLPSIFADKQAVMQVIDNLLSNAIKYSPHGKNVEVRLKSSGHSSLAVGREERHSSLAVGHRAGENSSPPTTQLTNDFLRIEIQDEGQGIAPEEMTKLFGKFVRLSARPTGGEHSTGLGLSIVKKMVEAMQGRVWCESEVGKGATFIVELPTHRQKDVS